MDPAVSSGAIHLEATARAIVPLSTGCWASLTLPASFDARATVAARPAVTGPALGGGSDAGNELALLFATPVLPAPTVPRATPLGAAPSLDDGLRLVGRCEPPDGGANEPRCRRDRDAEREPKPTTSHAAESRSPGPPR